MRAARELSSGRWAKPFNVRPPPMLSLRRLLNNSPSSSKPSTPVPSLPLSRRDALISASVLAASFVFHMGTAREAGPATHDVPRGTHRGSIVIVCSPARNGG
ncbi:hypothetical protein BQ8482_310080 [Mesorhizobium delmotii]|uniref:Uncharacterized protein n=1 Tax=Mesorhizobium delmotii TaxID=1631247 RepID=A0A2P9ANL6_9HYPH|nr:hypothetical protein BQ8482_310080 [Mesorhizobium delmotii]